ncbi:MAG: HAD-IA family hydrolase [Coriobacteriia bacterium]
MRLEAVFFDVGNTLLYPFPSVSAVVKEILLDAGLVHDIEAIEELIPLVDQYYEDRYREDDTFWADEGETSEVWVGMYTFMFRRLGIPDYEARGFAHMVYEEFGRPERWRPYDDVVPALERLKARGVKTGIISNWDRRLRSILVGLGLHGLLDAVVSSAMVGLHKPDPRIFELACGRLGVLPERAAHVGDHYYADVLGARVAGLAPVLIDRKGVPVPDGVEVIETLDGLEGALGLE